VENDKKKEMITEDRIIAAAIEEFIQKGYDATRMQVIADKANISKSALHYYFRHKERLFKKVLDLTAGKVLNKLHLDLTGLDSFPEKLDYGFRYYYRAISKNIKIIRFMFVELNRNPEVINQFLEEGNYRKWISSLDEELEKEYQAGRIRQTGAEQLILNIVSMCVFPYLSRGIACMILNIDHNAHKRILQEREEIVLQFIKDAMFIKEQ